MKFLEDKEAQKNFVSFNMLNLCVVVNSFLLNYLMAPHLIEYARAMRVDAGNIESITSLFGALTVLFVFVSNGIYLYASPASVSRAARFALLPAIYLFGANVYALIHPFASVDGEASSALRNIAFLVAGFTLLMPVLEIVYQKKQKKKTAEKLQADADFESEFGHLALSDSEREDLLKLPEADRRELAAAMEQNRAFSGSRVEVLQKL